MDRTIIDLYEAGAEAPRRALAGLSADLLDTPQSPGTWSPRQLVAHLMDSDLVGSYRMKRIIAMDDPPLDAYDQDRFVERLDYDRIDSELACAAFAANRKIMARLLRTLPDEAFARTGLHEETGRQTLQEQLKLYVWHLDHHLRFLLGKRAALGKPVEPSEILAGFRLDTATTV